MLTICVSILTVRVSVLTVRVSILTVCVSILKVCVSIFTVCVNMVYEYLCIRNSSVFVWLLRAMKSENACMRKIKLRVAVLRVGQVANL